MSVAEVQTEEQIFDASSYDLPIPKDRYGRKADKLIVQLGSLEIDRTSEDELAVFNGLEKGKFVSLRVTAYVVQATETSKSSEEGEEEAEVKRVLRVHSVEVA